MSTASTSKAIKSSALVASQPLPSKSGSTLVAAAAKSVSPDPVTGGIAGWTAQGGTPITIGAGDTIEAVSSRYGVPASALRAANGLTSGQPEAGQKLIIPAYNPSATVTKVAANAPKYQPAETTQTDAPRKPRYETLTPAAPKAQPQAKAQPKAERKPRYESLQGNAAGATSKPKPAVTTAKAPKAAATIRQDDADESPRRTQPKAVVTSAKTAQAQKKVAKAATKKAIVDDDDQPMPAKPKKSTKVATAPPPRPAAEPKQEARTEAPETTASASQDFRWPARGRVISGYGSKGTGGSNEGINISLPEGTPVKAAEAGTVAYASDEIKGYGKMVLIKHPNGYVSAYAHNGDLSVKRGDVVKRGQQIARSGQSGNVTSPQLHFELRKGSDPVDPSKYLE